MSGRKANFAWQSMPNTAATVWGSTVSNAVSFVDLGPFGIAQTIRRLIVDLYHFVPTLAAAASSGRVGVIVVAPQVVVVGAAAVPRPITDGERPWMWNRAYATNQEATTAGNTKDRVLHLHDDVRGMRKVKQDDHLIMVVENAVGSVIECVLSVRVLTST